MILFIDQTYLGGQKGIRKMKSHMIRNQFFNEDESVVTRRILKSKF